MLRNIRMRRCYCCCSTEMLLLVENSCSLESPPVKRIAVMGSTNSLQTQNYPYIYPNNAACKWLLAANKYNGVSVTDFCG